MPLNHLLRLLTLFALLLAPAGMLGNHMAMAAPDAAVAGGHCADMAGMTHESPGDEQDEGGPALNIDCTIMCSAIAAGGGCLADRIGLPATDAAPLPEAGGPGLNPAADPPPPRLA